MINYCLILIKSKIGNKVGEFGVAMIINTAIALIITAFILVPSLRNFATTMTGDLTSWYGNSVKNVMFNSK